MSTYNGEKYLPEQIDSILHQKFDGKLALLIRDDGSTDGTCELLMEYREKYPDIISTEFGDNIGYNASFFWLIQHAAKSDYYSISDQDDIWFEDKISVAVKTLESENADASTPLMYASTSLLYKNGSVIGTTRKKKRPFTIFNTIHQCICPGHTIVFNDNLRQLLMCDFDYSRMFVYDSWICNCAVIYGSVVFDQNSHALYRQHDENQLGSGKGAFSKAFSSYKKARRGLGRKSARQICYLLSFYEKEIRKIKGSKVLFEFCKNMNFFNRLSYVFRCKLYRQSRLETVLFRLAYLFGFYK